MRAYSHGCIRLADPFDFAYALLAPQSPIPEAEFQGHLKTGGEIGREASASRCRCILSISPPIPTAKGQMTYRRDVYGRDARIFEALTEAGVALPAVQG